MKRPRLLSSKFESKPRTARMARRSHTGRGNRSPHTAFFCPDAKPEKLLPPTGFASVNFATRFQIIPVTRHAFRRGSWLLPRRDALRAGGDRGPRARGGPPPHAHLPHRRSPPPCDAWRRARDVSA